MHCRKLRGDDKNEEETVLVKYLTNISWELLGCRMQDPISLLIGKLKFVRISGETLYKVLHTRGINTPKAYWERDIQDSTKN